MKLTQFELKTIIKEEIESLLENPRYENDIQMVKDYYRKINRLLDEFGTAVANSEIGNIKIQTYVDSTPGEFAFKVSNANIRYLKALREEMAALKREIS